MFTQIKQLHNTPMEAQAKRGGMAPTHSRPRWVVSVTPRPLYPQLKDPRYPLDRRWVGPRAGMVTEATGKSSLSPPGIEARSPGQCLHRVSMKSVPDSGGYSLAYFKWKIPHHELERAEAETAPQPFTLCAVCAKLKAMSKLTATDLFIITTDDGGSTHHYIVGLLLRDYMALYPRRLSSSYSPPWEPEISLRICVIKYENITENCRSPCF
jgi:hypothetical protein